MLARRILVIVVLALLSSRGAGAQSLPAGPVSALDGQLVVGAEVVATLGSQDDAAFFNYTDYEHNALRMFRASLAAAWRPVEPLAFVAEIRTEDMDQLRAYAAYVRFRPWASHEFDIQAGRIPPIFGAFARRTYSTDNLLIGYPLAYQYLTSIHPDSVPATVDDLLRMRGRGWRSSFPVGSTIPGPGVPPVSAFRWDTGVQARWKARQLEVAAAVTVGTLSDPRTSDNNSGRQLSARATWHPTPGLILGTSAARGAWLDRSVQTLLQTPDASYPQTAWGADAEYSRDHWLLRTEMILSRWKLPLASTAPAGIDIDALGAWVEGRYRFTPRIFAAARIDRLGFSRVARTPDGAETEWDAPVRRAEIAGGYYLQRNLVAKVAVQFNDREGGRVRERTFVSGQIAYWF